MARMAGASSDAFRFDPSLWSAIKRYWRVLLVATIIGGAIGVGYNFTLTKSYEASATVSIPPSQDQLFAGTNAAAVPIDQYLSNQLTLMQSPQVAVVAAGIINNLAHKQVVTPLDVQGSTSVSAASSSTSSAAAASSATTQVLFAWTGPKVAALGANAVVQAYTEVRHQNLQAQAQAAQAGLNTAINGVDQQLNQVNTQLTNLEAQQAAEALHQQQVAQAALNAGQKVAPTNTSSAPSVAQQALLAEQSSLTTRKSDLLTNLDQIETGLPAALAQSVPVLPAVPPPKPSNTHLGRYGALGAVIGLFLGIVIAYVLALRRRRFEDRFDPEGLYQVPLLGDVPVFEKEDLSSTLPVETDPASASAEAFRFVAASVRALVGEQGPLALTWTSADMNVGKTVVAGNTALALAYSGLKVLAIDGDFVRQDLVPLLTGDESPNAGLLEVLEGTAEVSDVIREVISGPGGGLWVLPAGQLNSARVAGLTRGRTRALLRELKGRYDLIIIDVPPILQTAFTSDLLAAADATVVVVDHHEPVKPHPEVIERLGVLGVEVIGYVYDRAPMRANLNSYYHNERLGQHLQRMSGGTVGPTSDLKDRAENPIV